MKLFNIGDILRMDESRYCVISILGAEEAVLCPVDDPGFNLMPVSLELLIGLVHDGTAAVEQMPSRVFDESSLTDENRRKYRARLAMIREVEKAYAAGGYLELTGHKKKPEVEAIIKKYEISRQQFWRVVEKYFKGGLREYTLVDGRVFGTNKGMKYGYTKKPGRKPTYFETLGVIPAEEHLEHMEDALQYFLSSGVVSIRGAYNYMNDTYYKVVTVVDGEVNEDLLPESERPTYKQFYDYVKARTTEEQVNRAKTSAREQRNNMRILESSVMKNVHGPGDLAEGDAREADVFIVSAADRDQTVCRPIIYYLVDVYSRVILAMSVALDNNSVLGITSLFVNLVEDKAAYAARYGITYFDPELWPSNIIPRKVRLDRGAEMKSEEFSRICLELGMERQNVPGATGSYKGVVEEIFKEMDLEINEHLEHRGLIEKRYDSDHKKTAVLDLNDYIEMVIRFVLAHNQRVNQSYKRSREMIKEDIPAAPVKLWEYGLRKYAPPRPVTDPEQFFYSLITPIKAKINKQGVTYKGLTYRVGDFPELRALMFQTQNKKLPFECRMDMRSIGAVYFIHDDRLAKLELNTDKLGDPLFAQLTMHQWEKEIRPKLGEMRARGNIHNELIAACNFAAYEMIVAEAAKNTFTNSDNLREAREIEKQAVSAAGKLETRLAGQVQIEDGAAKKPEGGNDAESSGDPGENAADAKPAGTDGQDATQKQDEHYEGYMDAFDDMEDF